MRNFRPLLTAALVLGSVVVQAPSYAVSEDDVWREIRAAVAADRPIAEDAAFLTLVAPPRAEDAAIVPIEVKINLPEGDPRRVKALTLIVDKNPAPVVGEFALGEPRRQFDLAVRVRVDSYSFVRAIAETDDGALHMVKAYVKAAGGCSAPAGKDPLEANANLGKMRFRTFADRGEAQVQMRHPNYSGLQMDQVTRHYTPAWYVETLSVRQGGKPVLAMKGGISISEDPTFRFSFKSNGEPITVEAKDTAGKVFRETFTPEGS